jgi:hypothetical protein
MHDVWVQLFRIIPGSQRLDWMGCLAGRDRSRAQGSGTWQTMHAGGPGCVRHAVSCVDATAFRSVPLLVICASTCLALMSHLHLLTLVRSKRFHAWHLFITCHIYLHIRTETFMSHMHYIHGLESSASG